MTAPEEPLRQLKASSLTSESKRLLQIADSDLDEQRNAVQYAIAAPGMGVPPGQSVRKLTVA